MQEFTLDLDYIQNEAEKIAERQSRQADFALSGDMFQFTRKGFYAIRLLGPYSTRGRIHREVYRHWQIPGKKGPVPCLRTWPELKKACPICDALDKLKANGVEYDTRMLAQMNAFVNCIPRDVDEKRNIVGEWVKPEGAEGDGFKVWVVSLPWTVHNWFMTQLAILGPRGKNPADPRKGMDITFTKVVRKNEKGKENTRYETPGFLIDEGPALSDPAHLQMAIEGIKDLDEFFPPPPEPAITSITSAATNLLVTYNLLPHSAVTAHAEPKPAPPPSVADLPPGWKRHTTPEGREYYAAPDGSTTWEKPKPPSALPPPPPPPPAPPPPPPPEGGSAKQAEKPAKGKKA